MKNKKMAYILLPVVVIIWGLIFYKIFRGTGKPKDHINKQFVTNSTSNEEISIDTIELIANYRDPFLKKLSNPVKKSVTPVIPEERAYKPKRPIKTKPLQWPDIIYNGMIQNQINNTKTILVNINNADFLVHKGDRVREIDFLEVYCDSIRVTYKNEIKTIKSKNEK